jgi:hypothetical protein
MIARIPIRSKSAKNGAFFIGADSGLEPYSAPFFPHIGANIFKPKKQKPQHLRGFLMF